MMDSVCGRESSLSPPSVVAPVAVKPSPPPPMSVSHAVASPTDQQRLLYQLALAERLRLASAGLAWARPTLAANHHHPFQDQTMGGHLMSGLMGTHLMGGFGSPLMGGLGTAAGLGSALMGGQGGGPPPPPPAAYPPPHPFYGYRLVDPRALLSRGPEEPKPQHSYIGLIAMAILSSPEKKLVLSDIYQYILDHYPYFRSRGPGWRNSIRHNLSLNDCFVKAGRSANGKGHYWAIHPANIDDFRRGDFRRRRAQRRVRKHLGLAVDDDSSPEPPSPPPSHTPTPAPDTPTAAHIPHHSHHLQQHQHTALTTESPQAPSPTGCQPQQQPVAVARKRQFDVASLLAPDDKLPKSRRHASDFSQDDHGDIDVVSDDPGDDVKPSGASPSPTTTGVTIDNEDDDRPWSLLGWVSGAPWSLPPQVTTSQQPPTVSDEGGPCPPSYARESCPTSHDSTAQ